MERVQLELVEALPEQRPPMILRRAGAGHAVDDTVSG